MSHSGKVGKKKVNVTKQKFRSLRKIQNLQIMRKRKIVRREGEEILKREER
jgi:hypothetical protein